MPSCQIKYICAHAKIKQNSREAIFHSHKSFAFSSAFWKLQRLDSKSSMRSPFLTANSKAFPRMPSMKYCRLGETHLLRILSCIFLLQERLRKQRSVANRVLDRSMNHEGVSNLQLYCTQVGNFRKLKSIALLIFGKSSSIYRLTFLLQVLIPHKAQDVSWFIPFPSRKFNLRKQQLRGFQIRIG